uniref:Uncharacterized protein n=1 Tax=Strombidium inclinatum TaxID=197538 RepID=A0A7S3IDN5_9SPIT|mmetsp:Transcript_12665/g.19685  ORF Transcript_12665/g.19685 Transcript_12665/m.19685 type:complete len:100 (+) Transcript_12665:667-966(+)
MTGEQSSSEMSIPPIRFSPYIVALSASEYCEDLLLRCKEAKFDDQFTQPLKKQEVLDRVIEKVLVRKNCLLMCDTIDPFQDLAESISEEDAPLQRLSHI